MCFALSLIAYFDIDFMLVSYKTYILKALIPSFGSHICLFCLNVGGINELSITNNGGVQT
jgi:hypothetical protein